MLRPALAWWGAREFEILLSRAPALLVRVRDDHGNPVSRFALACLTTSGGNGGGGIPMRLAEHAYGEQILHCVADGHDYALLVVPESQDLFAAAPQRVSRQGGVPDVVTVTLQRRRDVSVRCVDVRGAPLAGVRIAVLADVPRPIAVPGLPPVSIVDLHDVTCATLYYADAVTGVDGRADLRVAPDLRGYRWRLEGAGAAFHEHPGELRSGPIEFTIPDGGTLVVRGATGEQADACVSLLSTSASAEACPLRLPIPLRPEWRFDAAGSVTVTGIPAGEWHVELVGDEQPQRLGTVSVRDGSENVLWLRR